MLKIQNLDLTTKEILLYGANMTLNKGYVYGLSARNGSGKTTLLRTISGLRKELTGTIMIKENDNTLNLLNSKRKLFYYETSEWFDLNLSGLDYLKFIESTWRNKPHMSIEELISFWEMETYIKRPIKKYSLGMKQKVLLSMYAVSGASYLLFDEPTIGLDTNSLRRFERLITSLKNNNTTILFSSHQNDTLYKICDFIYEMEDKSLKLISVTREE
ncbi:ABC-2 type transport system ATP-binding protein [Gracilibacillus halotolerans]|uniref:ABC-2 type transport system ATP-binding protein n=1 Tax=Gracilibacillus halotolerans TaxID=74386 RepID=A0A841RP62_9BACI|nr:ABC transporter ATP-binding protein [Gracilibacillus halotolerans]MBB6513662.1 ABC-2 type transport system ATP-binding protein [Gracilibacillus halotolerans]